MGIYLFSFSYKGFTVTYRIMARSQASATRIARARERMWRLAVDQYVEEQASWS